MYNGKKIRLRAYRREDMPKAQEFMNDYEMRNLLATGVLYPILLEQEEKWYESLISTKDNYSFAIETLEDGKYIGGCGINKIDWNSRVITVGIFIGDKDYWGKGYGTDAMRVLVDFIFSQMNMNKIKLNVFSFNKRAMRCYEKCGFKVDGILRQEIFRDGQYYDDIVMSVLFDEWRLGHNNNTI